MRTFLKNFGVNSAEGLAKLEELSLTLEAQKAGLEHLTNGTADTLAQLQQFASIADRLASTERRLSAVEAMAAQLDLAEGKLAGLAASQLRLEARLAESSTGLDALRDDLAALGGTSAAAVRDAAAVTERIRAANGRLDDLAAAASAIDAGSGGLDALAGRVAAQNDRMEALDGRLATADERLAELAAVRTTLEAATRDLATATRSGESNREGLEALQRDLNALKELRQQQAAAPAEDPAHRAMLEGRDRQIGLLERRLAHADSLLGDLRTSLEALVAQKVQVDHLLERASAVPMETRRVEALLDTLRDERRASDRLCLALSELRHKQGQPSDPEAAAAG